MYSDNIVLIDNLENSRKAVKVILFNTLLYLHISESRQKTVVS